MQAIVGDSGKAQVPQCSNDNDGRQRHTTNMVMAVGNHSPKYCLFGQEDDTHWWIIFQFKLPLPLIISDSKAALP